MRLGASNGVKSIVKPLLVSCNYNIKLRARFEAILPIMKTSEQTIKGERVDVGASLNEVQMQVSKAEFDAAAAESEERNLEIELLKAEAAAQKKNEAEQRSTETKERINEAVA